MACRYRPAWCCLAAWLLGCLVEIPCLHDRYSLGLALYIPAPLWGFEPPPGMPHKDMTDEEHLCAAEALEYILRAPSRRVDKAVLRQRHVPFGPPGAGRAAAQVQKGCRDRRKTPGYVSAVTKPCDRAMLRDCRERRSSCLAGCPFLDSSYVTVLYTARVVFPVVLRCSSSQDEDGTLSITPVVDALR
jgi:hypothetical protein